METLSIERPSSREMLEKTAVLMPWQIEILGEPFIEIFNKTS
jgi:hypothetical protein